MYETPVESPTQNLSPRKRPSQDPKHTLHPPMVPVYDRLHWGPNVDLCLLPPHSYIEHAFDDSTETKRTKNTTSMDVYTKNSMERAKKCGTTKHIIQGGNSLEIISLWVEKGRSYRKSNKPPPKKTCEAFVFREHLLSKKESTYNTQTIPHRLLPCLSHKTHRTIGTCATPYPPPCARCDRVAPSPYPSHTTANKHPSRTPQNTKKKNP